MTAPALFPGSPYSLYKDGKLKKFTIPGATGPGSIGINVATGPGFGGGFYNADTQQPFGFTSIGGKFTTYALPSGSIGISVLAIGPNHKVAGYLIDPSGYYHGFIYEDKDVLHHRLSKA